MVQKKLKKLTFILLAIMLVGVYSCESESIDSSIDIEKRRPNGNDTNRIDFDLSQDCSTNATTNLYAGQNILVGEVTVGVVGDNYVITYKLTNNGFCITETHLSVVNEPGDFPISGGGNPKNGHFEYSNSHECVSSYSYEVPVSKGPYIAAHAVVNCVESYDETEFEASLPETLDFCIRTGREVDDARGYFRLNVDEGELAGTYWAWCADMDKAIEAEGGDDCYVGFNVLSLSDNLSSIISQTDNIDNALWLINNVDSLLDSGDYLYGHVQWAFWQLLNEQDCDGCNDNLKLPDGDYKDKGMQIVNLALANGDDYMPDCADKSIIFLDNGVDQPLIVPVTINCENAGDCEETAWADGCDFPGNNWATYFKYSN